MCKNVVNKIVYFDEKYKRLLKKEKKFVKNERNVVCFILAFPYTIMLAKSPRSESGGIWMGEYLFSAKGIKKSFGPTVALNGVDIYVNKGEIHGFIGENGSGKSTLSNIAAGVLKMDSGEMEFMGRPYRPVSVLDASRSGVCMIAQEQGNIDQLTVTSNIFLGREDLYAGKTGLKIGAMHKEAKRLLRKLGVEHIDPAVPLGSLNFEDKKLVEIARAQQSEPKLLIVDETTTALAVGGRSVLYNFMQRMRDEGNAVLFISHDIEEVMKYCDSITILRDGNVTARLVKEDFDANAIRQLMVGREISENYYRSDFDGSCEPEVVLSAEHICTKQLKDVSVELHKGEILGIAGLTDSGMRELGKAMFGLVPLASGRVKCADGNTLRNVDDAVAHNIGYVSKNRDAESLMPVCSIRENICLPSLKHLSKAGIITNAAERTFVDEATSAMSVKMSSMEAHCTTLSGGNKQKVVLAKWLGRDSDIFILDCPTRGIDIGVKADIYALLYELKKKGKAILMISEELPELIGMSDRVIVIKDGAITGEYRREERLTESELIQHMI